MEVQRAAATPSATTPSERESVCKWPNLRLSILIPAYNEAENLASFVQEVIDTVTGLIADYEIIICDDASTDDTATVVRRLCEANPQVRGIYHTHNQGIFTTFDELYHEAGHEWVILLPGDGQWSPSLLHDALPRTATHDIIIAARREKQYNWLRLLNSWGFNALVRLLFRIDLHDVGAAKLVRRKIYRTIRVAPTSAFMEAELCIEAQRRGFKIGVIWVTQRPRRGGKARGASPGKVLDTLRAMAAFIIQPRLPQAAWKERGEAATGIGQGELNDMPT